MEQAGLERGIPASEKARRLLEESEKLPAADKSLLQLYRQTQERMPGFEKEPEKRKDIDRIYQEVIYKLYQGELLSRKSGRCILSGCTGAVYRTGGDR